MDMELSERKLVQEYAEWKFGVPFEDLDLDEFEIAELLEEAKEALDNE